MSNQPEQDVRGGLPVSPEQCAVVDHVLEHPFTVVDAGAGSGKTRTTIAATFELLMRRPEARLDQFVLITFTREAATKLRHELELQLLALQRGATTDEERRHWTDNRERASGAFVGTIHAFCRQTLKTYGHGAKVARLSDMEFARGRLNEALEEVIEAEVLADGPRPLRRTDRQWRLHNILDMIRKIYEELRNRGRDPEKVLEATERQRPDDGHAYRVALARAVVVLHRVYRAKKDEEHKLDSTDLLLYAAEVLESGEDGPTILRRIASQYRYQFIDEFQDTDPIQKRLLDRLKPHLEATMVVGDGKQSIYEFRGANLSLRTLAAECDVTPLSLTMSRRPTKQLLDSYNALFRRMSERYPELGQLLQPFEQTIEATTDIPPVTMLHVASRGDQRGRIERVAKLIPELIGQPLDEPGTTRDLEAGDIALLFRKNETLAQYEEQLRPLMKAQGIEIRHESSQRFYRQPEVLGVYRILRLLLDERNVTALTLALDTLYCRQWNLPEIQEVRTSYLWHGRERGNELVDKFVKRCPEAAGQLAELRSAMRTDTVAELLGRLDETLGLRQYHRQRGDRRGEEILERLRELPRSLSRSEQALTLSLFVKHLQRCIQTDAPGPEEPSLHEEKKRPKYVRLMSVHAAKGLEFPVVILPEVQTPLKSVGFSDFVVDEADGLDVNIRELTGQLQTRSAAFWDRLRGNQDTALEEEMRIFYVAITRAQNHVVFVGADLGNTFEPRQDEYSWQDEVYRAWHAMAEFGAKVLE